MKKTTFRASATRAKNDFNGVVVIEKIKKLREKGRPQNVCHFGRGSFSTHHKENIE